MLRECAADLTSDELLDVIEEAQREKDAASARQAVALAHLSAREPHLQEDGTTVEVHHGLGHQRLDAPELAAPRLGVSVHVATRRVTAAIDQMTRTPAVVDAMAVGVLDEQRAAVVTEETEFLSPESAGKVVALVADRWRGLTTGPLRRLLARTAAQVDPEAVAAHAEDERERRGLTRRLGVHGTDHWRGDFRVEQSRVAWAAVTERARELVRGGHADTLEKARADAMMELILEHCDVRVVVHTTRAADTTTDAQKDAAPAADATGEDDHTAAGHAASPQSAHAESPATSAGTAGPERACRNEHRESGLVEVGGLGAPGTTFVPRAWLDGADTSSTNAERELTCDPDTGAILAGDVPEALASGRTRRSRPRPRAEDPTPTYRVPAEMARLVRLRDGSCRFPGCATPARQCDLDHVRPWPTGPTAPTNLIALCRRHHRIKQRPGWTLRLHPDARVTWHDPTGRAHTTWPVDHLHLATPACPDNDELPPTTPGTSRAAESAPSAAHDLELPTTFEDELHDLLEQHAVPPRRTRPTVWNARGQLLSGPPPRTDHHTGRTRHRDTGRHTLVVLDLPHRPPPPPSPASETIPF
ncbi:HNH endonuclease [Knoellia locipacati]|uniref:HNH endonuclease signature motif containing protein n=1 Tax=Knoellia locipacati TaxID=882824 RepID=UPI00384B1503